MKKSTWTALVVVAALGLGLGLLAGCDDDDGPVGTQDFRFTLTVVDTAGDPVAGARIIMVPELPYYQDGKPAGPQAAGSRASVAIPFEVARRCDVELIIEDLQGTAVFSYSSEDVDAGSHRWLWNGCDNDDVHQQSGVYRARIVMRDTLGQEVLFDESESMLMVLLDFDQETMGTTDSDGRLVMTDARLFPHVLDAEDQIARDENGDDQGLISFTGEMRFIVWVPGVPSMRFVRQISGLNELELVWDPRGKAPSGPEEAPGPGAVPEGRLERQAEKGADFPPVENRLYPPYPNPFN